MSETQIDIHIDLDDFVAFLQATSKDQAREMLRHVIAQAYALGRDEAFGVQNGEKVDSEK